VTATNWWISSLTGRGADTHSSAQPRGAGIETSGYDCIKAHVT
jgi:hypothetical protein